MGKKKRVRTDDPVKCIAHSSRTGQPCKNPPMQGGNVCRMHGGAAAQVRRRAAERIALASDGAAAHLIKWMQDDSVPYPVRVAAAKDLLDRAPVNGKQIIELEAPAWQQILDGIVATVEPGVEMRPFAEAQPQPDPLVVEAQRVDEEEYTPDDSDWSHPEAYGHDLPTTLPHPKTPTKTPAHERAMPTVNGDDRPPPRHPMPERRRIEPEDDRPRPRRRVAGRR